MISLCFLSLLFSVGVLHISANFGPKSTAKQVIQSFGRLDGKTAIVTGANSGIGLELTKQLAGAGCHVIASVRDIDSGSRSLGSFDEVEVRQMDLASLKSIESFVSSIDVKEINFLVNNAGVMAVPTLSILKMDLRGKLAQIISAMPI